MENNKIYNKYMNSNYMNNNYMNSNYRLLIIPILIIFMFFFIIMPIFDNCYNNTISTIQESLENIDNNSLFPNNSEGIMKIDNNKCSKNCCNLSQWKLPPELIEKDNDNYSNYISSNLSCISNGKSGCLCLRPDDFNYLKLRGLNS